MKYGKDTLYEVLCYDLCRKVGVPCAKVTTLTTGDGVIVSNITSPYLFLEQADMSGKLAPECFTDSDVITLFGWPGAQMLLVDAMVGNEDRHAGNFGWLRDTETGEYVCMADLYDFDHAFDMTTDSDVLIDSAVQVALSYKDDAIRLLQSAISVDIHEVFTSRAKSILNCVRA